MKKFFISNYILIILGFFMFFSLFSVAHSQQELTQQELEKYIQLPKGDGESLLHSLIQVFTETWIETTVSDSLNSTKQAILLITREAVRQNIINYLLIEGPKEVGTEIVKMGFKIGKLAIASDISDLMKEFEKMTVKESLNYLGEWLKENQVKTATGNLNFSYETLDKKKQKHTFQYIIVYSPEDESIGEAVITIYSSQSIAPPFSKGSPASSLGITWLYPDQLIQDKIPPFILSISGKVEREQSGYWQGQIIHRYSWASGPKVELTFPDNVPYFDFHEKGFFEKVGDKIKGFFQSIGDLFSGASLVEPPLTEESDLLNNIGQESVQLSPDSGFGQFIKQLLDWLNIFKQFLTNAQYQSLQKDIQNISTGQDLTTVLKRLEQLQEQFNKMGLTIDMIQNKNASSSINVQGEDENLKDNQLPAQPPSPKSAKLVINEVCAGLDNSKNEFIELYNPNAFPVSLDSASFQLKLVSQDNKITKKKIDWLENIIPSHGYFLFVGGELVINNKTVEADANFGSQLTSVSGVIIADANDNILDKVGWGKADKAPPLAAVEKSGKVLDGGLKTGQGLERSNYLDTDNNSSDFLLSASPSPYNSLGDKAIYIPKQNESNLADESAESEGTGSGSGTNNSTSGGGEGSISKPACSQQNLFSPVRFPVIFNEIAWMGTATSSNDEWIELKNISAANVSLTNWQILDKGEQIRIIFEDNDFIPAGGFYLLERSDDDSVPGIKANKIYSGSLSNSDETLRLFSSNCDLIDQAVAAPNWPAGDNITKKTMERGSDLNWHNYYGSGANGIMGTPKAENSIITAGGQENNNEEENGEGQPNEAQGLLITEVRAAGNEEFVEIYNPLGQSVSVDGWYLSYFSAGHDWNDPLLNKVFPSSTPLIAAKNYYLIGFGDYPGSNPDNLAPDWKPYNSHLSDNDGAMAIFSCNPKNTTTTQEASACKIDALGWGSVLVKEGESAVAAQNGSLARKLAPDNQGHLQYIDTDNNKQDFEGQEATPDRQNVSNYPDLDNDGTTDSLDSATNISKTTTLEAGEYIFKDLIIEQGASLVLNSDLSLSGFRGVKIIADNVVINQNATIVADKKGYGGGIAGPGSGNSGEGANYGGIGGRNFDSDLAYGDLTAPTELGSAGPENPIAPGLCLARPGGAGGGAIILEVENVLTAQGVLSANGEDGLGVGSWGCAATGAGSGGSIYIIANTIEGSGTVSANGGNAFASAGAGGGGRVAIRYNTNNFSGAIEAYGGQNTENLTYSAGAGTIYLKSGGALGDLLVSNNGVAGDTILTENNYSFRNVEISKSSHFYLPASLNCVNFDIENNALVEATAAAVINASGNLSVNQSSIVAPALQALTIGASNVFLENSRITANLVLQANNLVIDNNSSILSTGLGYDGQEGPGAGINSSGGGYGGRGGANASDSIYGAPYGSREQPIDFGSGGGNTDYFSSTIKGARGGGKIKLNIGNSLSNNGEISANGQDGRIDIPRTGAGSGGSVFITTNVLEGSGKISANGGQAFTYAVGGGGGGRIAVYYSANNFAGTIETKGGANNDAPTYSGQNGTIYLNP